MYHVHNAFPIFKGIAHLLSPHAFCPFLMNLDLRVSVYSIQPAWIPVSDWKASILDVCIALSWLVSIPRETMPMISPHLPLSYMAGEKYKR